MNKKLVLVVLSSLIFVCQAALARQPLTFEERVKAQEAIERVYYNHRIWPKENPTPKPSFEQMVPRAMLEAKVTDYLKKSAALDEFWQKPITSGQLQAEMDRMARGTKDAATLRELFAALNNDPTLIAECLARPILSDRLIRNWYASDERLHGEAKARAEAALASARGGSLALCNDGNYQRVVYVLSSSGARSFVQEKMRPGEIALDSTRFEKELQESPEEGKPAILLETSEAFLLVRAALKTSTRIEIETLAFPKRDIEEWVKTVELSGPTEAAAPVGFAFAIPTTLLGDCTGDAWAQTSTSTDCPSIRWHHTAVWTGTEMIVWGGGEDNSYLNTGGRYSPSTDSWTATSTGANCPSSRRYHTAVWTGTEMIVWSGRGSSYLITGGRYNPSTDSWTGTSTTNAPSGRIWHTAVWTGTEMVVWGGHQSSGSLNTGGRYAPSTDTWTATSVATDCPSVREDQTAVWAGTEMIIWGGDNNGSTFLNTGARYNPSTDSWVATSLTDAPSGRCWHSAVWTGTEMIIWGGTPDGSSCYNTGGRYNPSSNLWAPTSVGAGVPSGRYSHSSVWTGSFMIMWGGCDSISNYFNTGAQYDPSTDNWGSTSTLNAPPGRKSHTAVWTGVGMIVWGGYNNSGFLNTGGVYSTGVPYSVPATSLSWTGTDKDTLSWSAADCATSYRVYRGDPGQLQNLPTGASVCMAYDGNGSNATTTGSTLTLNPAAGSFFWYLSVGYNANGEGPAGQSSYGPRMIISTGSCP